MTWEHATKDTGAHMKTTLDLSDSVLARAKAHASREGRTLRAVVEDALRLYLEGLEAGAGSAPRPAFRIQPWGRGGFLPEYRERSWSEILDEINQRPDAEVRDADQPGAERPASGHDEP